MFEASVKAVTEAYPNQGGVIALIGGTQEQRTEWANHNVVAPAVLLSLDFKCTSGPAPIAPQHVIACDALSGSIALRGRTLAGAVVFDDSVDDTVLRTAHNALLTAATLLGIKPSELLHFINGDDDV